MKKTLVTSLLGIAACTSAFGQGVIQFNNYQSTSYQQVKYANDSALGANSGTAVTSPTVELQLFWAVGTFGSQAAFNTAANAGVTTFIQPGFNFNGGGYYGGPNQLLTGWTAGQSVTFQVQGWGNQRPQWWCHSFGLSEKLSGTSGLWSEVAGATASSNGIQPSSNPATFFNQGPPAMTLDLVPEPSTFALAGLGAAALA